jgi:CheY-like chemotaxis protein
VTALSAARSEQAPVRVVVVDDNEDLRVLLRLHFIRDGRFVVVGEAGNGKEAIVLAERTQPDVIVLDRRMPVMDGLEAMPAIRRVAPTAAIILYTTGEDPWTYQAAVDAGALEVLEKSGAPRSFVDRLVRTLIEKGSAKDCAVEVVVGPVSADAARVWVANTREIIEAVAANPGVVGTAIPDDVLELFRSFLRQWAAVAEGTDEFRWVAVARLDEIQHIVGYWATIDAMTDEQLEQLGVHWSPPEGQPFFQALTTGVLATLERHEVTHRLASRLAEQWAPYRVG